MKDHNALRASFILFVLNASIPATASWADDCFLEDTYDCVLPTSGGIVVWDSTGWNCDAWENASPMNRSSTMLDSCNLQGRRFCYGLLDVGVNHIELASHIENDRRTKSIGSCDDYRDNRSSDCAGTIGNVWLDFIANGGGAQCPNEFIDHNTGRRYGICRFRRSPDTRQSCAARLDWSVHVPELLHLLPPNLCGWCLEGTGNSAGSCRRPQGCSQSRFQRSCGLRFLPP